MQYLRAHYTSCFQQSHLINNKCPVITAAPPPSPFFLFCLFFFFFLSAAARPAPSLPIMDPMTLSVLTCSFLGDRRECKLTSQIPALQGLPGSLTWMNALRCQARCLHISSFTPPRDLCITGIPIWPETHRWAKDVTTYKPLTLGNLRGLREEEAGQQDPAASTPPPGL